MLETTTTTTKDTVQSLARHRLDGEPSTTSRTPATEPRHRAEGNANLEADPERYDTLLQRLHSKDLHSNTDDDRYAAREEAMWIALARAKGIDEHVLRCSMPELDSHAESMHRLVQPLATALGVTPTVVRLSFGVPGEPTE